MTSPATKEAIGALRRTLRGDQIVIVWPGTEKVTVFSGCHDNAAAVAALLVVSKELAGKVVALGAERLAARAGVHSERAVIVEQLDDLKDRLVRAVNALDGLAAAEGTTTEGARLRGKAAGVSLAIDYLRAYK